MYGGPQLVLPLLRCPVSVGIDTIFCLHLAYPGNPCAAPCAKRDLPGRVEGLEELVGLEEGLDAEGIEDAECDQEDEDILSSRGLLDSFHRSPARAAAGRALEPVRDHRTLGSDLGRSLRHGRRRWRRRHGRADALRPDRTTVSMAGLVRS